MAAITVKNFSGKILIIGPIYDKIDKLQRALTLINHYDLVIFNGNLCYPNNNIAEVKERIELINQYLIPNKVLYNLGNYDLILIKETNDAEIKNWLESKSNVIFVEFMRGSYLIVTSGGVTPTIKGREDLTNNIETSFVSNINDKSWHNLYKGQYGYIVSNNPLTLEPPHFYNFSAQIGNVYGNGTQVYAQEVTENGLQQTILL